MHPPSTNAGSRPVRFVAPSQQHFVPPQNYYQNGQRPQGFVPQQFPSNAVYPQFQQAQPIVGNNDSRPSPPSAASTPALAPSNHGNPIQPLPPVFYMASQRPNYQLQGQQYYIVNPSQVGAPPPSRSQVPPFAPRPPVAMPYPPVVHQNYTGPPRYALPMNPQCQPMEYIDPSMQQQPFQQPTFHQPRYSSNYQGKRGRGGGNNSNQSSRRGSVRHEGRPESANKPSSQPSPESQLPPFNEQNVPIPTAPIVQQNLMYAMTPIPGSMIQQPIYPVYGQPPLSQENPLAQQVYMVQNADGTIYHTTQPPPFYMINPTAMQQAPLEPEQPMIPPSQPANQEPINMNEFAQACAQAIEELKEEQEKDHSQSSSEKTPEDVPAGVPALDATSGPEDTDYTPPGTPQSLNPLNEQQMEQLVAAMGKDLTIQEAHSGKDEEAQKQESNRRRQPKPEQQHYQPPGRSNARRLDSWRSNSSQQSTHLSKITEEEKPKSASVVSTPTVPSDTPTPRASPTPPPPPPQPKPITREISAEVPMIGGVPLILTDSGEKVGNTMVKERCAYCEMINKPVRETTTHSLMSASGLPACPAFREAGCELCGAKGDSAHLSRFCKMENRGKENVNFKNMANHFFDMTDDTRRGILIRDLGNHPTVESIENHPDAGFQAVSSKTLKQIFVKQGHFAQQDQKDFDAHQKFEQQQKERQQQARFYEDQRGYRGSRSGPRGSGYPQTYHNRGSRGGGGGGPSNYNGSRSRDGNRIGGGGGGGPSRGGRFDSVKRGGGGRGSRDYRS